MKVISTYTGEEFDLDDFKGVGPGWNTIIVELADELYKLGWSGHVSQIKEKFGGLRFYADDIPEGGLEAIDRAERLSYTTCEECGNIGKPRNEGWVRALCDSCAGE